MFNNPIGPKKNKDIEMANVGDDADTGDNSGADNK